MPIINKAISMVYAAVLIMVIAFPLDAQSQLLVPVSTGFSHWDHHWIMWTPRHPVYEAVEVMSVDNPHSPSGKLVRVFLTERAGGKKQVNYFNDASVAKRWKLEAYRRDIEYRIEGELGRPLNLYVKFKDKGDKWIELMLQFDNGQEMTTQYAGLTDQVGHAADSRFLVFYREKTAVAAKSKLLMGSEDYSIKGDQPNEKPYFYRTGYRSNIYAATVAYGHRRFKWSGNELTDSEGQVFKRVAQSSDGTIYRSKSNEDQTTVEVVTNSTGEIRQYRHLTGEHIFQIEFEPALPGIKSAKTGQSIQYKMSLDNFKNLVFGIISVKKEGNMILFDWQHQAPNWTKDYYFQSSVLPNSSVGYDLAVSRKE